MNLFIHGIDGKIELGNSYNDDKHADLRADYILANPPFNDGSKAEHGWGADKIPAKDPRLTVGDAKLTLSPRNANTMWILHFLYHLVDGGAAGFVMATGELSNAQNARLEARKTLIEGNYVDCIVQLSGQLFANTQIPCSLWFLSKSRDGKHGERHRLGEVLFIDGRNLGSLIPGSRKQKQLSAEEVEQIAAVYRHFRRKGIPSEQPGFCKVARIEEIAKHGYALTPGRYVGTDNGSENGAEPFEERMPKLLGTLREQFAESDRLRDSISRSVPFGTGCQCIFVPQCCSGPASCPSHVFGIWTVTGGRPNNVPGGAAQDGAEFTHARASADRQPDQSLDSQPQKIRSRVRSSGRLMERWSAINCCRRARFSAISTARPAQEPRTSNHTA